jgi:hypothetical protein
MSQIVSYCSHTPAAGTVRARSPLIPLRLRMVAHFEFATGGRGTSGWWTTLPPKGYADLRDKFAQNNMEFTIFRHRQCACVRDTERPLAPQLEHPIP